jgi:hypothetical protein
MLCVFRQVLKQLLHNDVVFSLVFSKEEPADTSHFSLIYIDKKDSL